MDLEINWRQISLDSSSTEDRRRQVSYDVTYMWNVKYDTNEFIHEIETQTQKTN